VNEIAPRQAVSNYRRIHRVEALEPGYEPKVAWDVDVRVFDLPRAMQRLSARQRQIVEAKSAGYSAGEIAAKLGLSVATVYSQYSRAVAEIRRQMNSRPPMADAA
jgi:DNA-directed RNA polymerase specialized sigma24 family protein